MRLIDADALYEELRYMPYDNILEGTIDHDRPLRAIMNAPTADGWISVKDEMPMQIETVLFIGKNCHGDWFRAKRGYFDGTFWHSDDSGTVYSTTPVTHWMPLPEPPEEVN